MLLRKQAMQMIRFRTFNDVLLTKPGLARRCLGPAGIAGGLLRNERSQERSSKRFTHDLSAGRSHTSGRSNFLLFGGLVGAAALGSYFLHESYKCREDATQTSNQEISAYFSKEEISKHKTKATGIWVTYQHNVYDITDFVDGHPGGPSKIMLAAGGPVEPYWDMYAIHKKDEVQDILSEYKIGEVRPEDRVVVEEKKDGPFSRDPSRHPALIANSQQPFNAETPPQLAVDDLVTPNELFFVRNHLPVPVVDEKDFQLEILNSDGGKASIKLSLDDLKTKFPRRKVLATLQCAGNRRSEMNEAKPVRGLSWTSTAISNAEWEGVLLRDVLEYAGVDFNDPVNQHVQFEGLDIDPTKAPYGGSIPIYKVSDSSCDVILAFSMNGKTLPRDHGYPLRVIAPGVVGARNVKWLSKVTVSKEESNSHWQKNDYKGFSPNIDWHNVDFSTAPAILEAPVNSVVCTPANGSTVVTSDEDVRVSGYAYSGGGRAVIRVDVTADEGKTWHTAQLKQAEQPLHKMWSWTLWTIDLPIPEQHNGSMKVQCKAVDSSYNTQPEKAEHIWNLRGVLNNSWHQVKLAVENDEDE
eukprot:gene17520-19270_t